jgi:hypothetical protein
MNASVIEKGEVRIYNTAAGGYSPLATSKLLDIRDAQETNAHVYGVYVDLQDAATSNDYLNRYGGYFDVTVAHSSGYAKDDCYGVWAKATGGGQNNYGIYAYGSDFSGYFTQADLVCTSDVVAFYSSDKRLKKNIVKIDNAVSKISTLNGITFEWNEKAPKSKRYELVNNKRSAGVIAQDVQKVLPEAVKEREDGYLAIKYEQLIPLLIEGMKEQQGQIDDLKQQIEDIKDA